MFCEELPDLRKDLAAVWRKCGFGLAAHNVGAPVKRD
jgi:hypothetical protein